MSNSVQLVFEKTSLLLLSLLLLFMLQLPLLTQAQTTLSGKVSDDKGQVLVGSNVYLLNSLDGTSTDADGKFSFQSSATGSLVLVISSLGYETRNVPVSLGGKAQTFDVNLKEAVNHLDEVVISAGTFEANNDRKVALLRPLDIVTTAGAGADIVAAIQTLPGTQRVGEQTGLFVRGGDASESLTIIDGMIVQNAFQSSVPGVAQRSRFSPFQFKGISFSSGGYSARYGQALSSVLELNTLDLPEKSTLTLGANMAGVYASGAKRGKNSGVEITANYTNITPFLKIANTNFDFYKAPQGGNISGRWVLKSGDRGLLKMVLTHSLTENGIRIPDPATPGERINFGLKNNNTYFNSSYRQAFSSKWSMFTALSLSDNIDRVNQGGIVSQTNDWRGQFRGEVAYDASNAFTMLAGIEFQRFHYQQVYDILRLGFQESQLAAYAEAEWKPRRWLAVKPGFRMEHSWLLNRHNAGPRLSLAVKTGKYSQVATAGGVFFQNAGNRYLLAGYRPGVDTPGFQQAVHYIANYQWSHNDRTFRVETYYKSYNDLIREQTNTYNPNPYRYVYVPVDNSGHGYAKGIDFFWRDKALAKNLDYWISYSLIDTKRLYENYPVLATPSFVSNHNLNVITKYYVEKWRLSFGFSYNYASGRPYYRPDSPTFLGDKTPDYHNLALNMAYLTSIGNFFTVIYLSADNLTNRKNIYGYRYSNDGQQRYPIQPALYRSVFVGINLSLTTFKKEEL